MACFVGVMRGEIFPDGCNQCLASASVASTSTSTSTSIAIASDIDIARPIYFPARSRRRGG
jgi:hypothetical protein